MPVMAGLGEDGPLFAQVAERLAAEIAGVIATRPPARGQVS